MIILSMDIRTRRFALQVIAWAALAYGGVQLFQFALGAGDSVVGIVLTIVLSVLYLLTLYVWLVTFRAGRRRPVTRETPTDPDDS